MDDGSVMPRISKPELVVAVILLSVLLVLLGSTLVLSLFQPVCEETVHLSGNIKYTRQHALPFSDWNMAGGVIP